MKKKDYFIALLLVSGVIISGLFLTLEMRNSKVAATAKVNISQSGFVPEVVSIDRGTVVTFVNTDSSKHHIVSDLEGFDSNGALEADDSYSFVFAEQGTWKFQDANNPLLYKGEIIVK